MKARVSGLVDSRQNLRTLRRGKRVDHFEGFGRGGAPQSICSQSGCCFVFVPENVSLSKRMYLMVKIVPTRVVFRIQGPDHVIIVNTFRRLRQPKDYYSCPIS